MFRGLLKNKIAIVGSIALCLSALPAAAQEESVFDTNARLGFFNQDSVVNLDRPLEYSNQQEIQMGPTKGFNLAKDFAVDKTQMKDGSKQDKKAEEKIPEGVDPQEYTLKKEFGDPSVPVPVKGVDTAPTPYKAMLKAIDMGRDDLALQYAEQWMGYMKSLERITKKATSMSQLAGMRSDHLAFAIANEPIDDIDPAGLQKYMETQRQKEGNSVSAVSMQISDSEKESINALFGGADDNTNAASALSKNSDPYSDLVNVNLDTTARRALIRSRLAGKLPQDPKGLVKILYFLKPSDLVDLSVGRAIASALSSAELTVPVSVVPLSVEPLKTTSSSQFINATGLPATLRDGVALSRSLKLASTPALVFSTESSSQVFIKSGQIDPVFIEEVCKMIGGK